MNHPCEMFPQVSHHGFNRILDPNAQVRAARNRDVCVGQIFAFVRVRIDLMITEMHCVEFAFEDLVLHAQSRTVRLDGPR